MFSNKNLECDNCKREFLPNDELIIHLTLPEYKKMPVGVLDKVIGKHSNSIHCKRCIELISKNVY
ncbi:hypothetical protein ACFSTH_13005 [Paenibacillus yanchengensis]